MRSPEAIDDLDRPLRPRPRRRRAQWKPRHPARTRSNDRLVGTRAGAPPAGRRHRQRPPRDPGQASARSRDGRDPCPAQHRRARRVAGPLGVGTPAQWGGDGAALRPLPGCGQPHRRPSPASSPSTCTRPRRGCPSRGFPRARRQAPGCGSSTERGFQERYAGTPHERDARARVDAELEVILRKDFAGYFVIVHDIVEFARDQGILCQGRGSAASSAVCFALGITAIDSVYYRLPFERFISEHREEEPDIDVDFDSDRREEVIQWVYETYGRRNAAQVCNIVSYRPRMAVRDAAKALGFSTGQQDAWCKSVDGWSSAVEAESEIPRQVVSLAEELLSAPRHLGIHSGGMVLTERPIGEVCPIERARMPGRTVLQWDKDGCETMGLVKFDLLGLGMLGALDHMMRLIEEHLGTALGTGDDPEGGARGLRHALPGRLHRGLPGREPRPDRHPAPAQAPLLLRPRHRDRADPARTDPGRRRPPLHPPRHRQGAGHLRPPVARAGARAHPRRPALPGAADGDGGDAGGLQPGRCRPAPPRDGLQARCRADREGQGEALRRHGHAAASPATRPTAST